MWACRARKLNRPFGKSSRIGGGRSGTLVNVHAAVIESKKNGGCNHMTCRCGHEICWRCGGDYVKHGRRGHSEALFPRPSELKYCCNNGRQWAERVGAVALLSTVGVAAVTIYCAGKITKEVLFKMYDVAAYTPRLSLIHI